jgi:pilus assembly protein CpaB
MGRRMMAVFAALVVGLIGVAAVLFYASGADARAVADQRPQTVYVAQQLVPSGTTAADAVAKGLMVPTRIAAVGVPAGALTTVDAATGRLVALSDIAAGSFVVASRFGVTPIGSKAIQVPDGQVAVSVAFTDPARVSTFLTPGSRIVIYDTYQPAAAATAAGKGAVAGRETRVLLDDVLVIAVGSTSLTPTASSNGQTQAPAAGALVTVALAPDTATRLVQGIQTGTLYAGLRGTGANADLGQIVSESTLFNK